MTLGPSEEVSSISRGFNQRPSPALVVALLALFVALGGGAYAASSFIGSDGQVHACIGKKGQLTVLKAGKKCGKGKSAIAWNQQGPRGIRGIQGIQGPGAISVEREFDFDVSGTSKDFDTLVNGFRVQAKCDNGSALVRLARIDSNHGFYAWGTSSDGNNLSHTSPNDLFPGEVFQSAPNNAELDVVAESTAPGEAIKATRFDLTVVRGTKCHLHGLITPPSSVG